MYVIYIYIYTYTCISPIPLVSCWLSARSFPTHNVFGQVETGSPHWQWQHKQPSVGSLIPAEFSDSLHPHSSAIHWVSCEFDGDIMNNMGLE